MTNGSSKRAEILRVLVIEDDRASLELMSEVLQSFGAEVTGVPDGSGALEQVNSRRFDGIFLDLMMPDLDGFRTARLIRQSSWNRTTPIVIVTGHDGKKVMDEAFKAGANFFLQKPVDRGRLRILLNSTRGAMLLNRRTHRRVSVKMEVECILESTSVRGYSCDISEGGILLRAEQVLSLEIGSLLKLQFRLPAQNVRIEAQARVMSLNEKKQVGVQFTSLSTIDRNRLRLFIGEQMSDAPFQRK